MFFKINRKYRVNINEIIEYGLVSDGTVFKIELTFKQGQNYKYTQESEEAGNKRIAELDEILLYHKPKGGFIE